MIGLNRNPKRDPKRGTDAHHLLIRDLLARLPHAALLASRTERWASVTFTGMRHIVLFDLRERAAADAFAAAAREIEFDLRGHVVIEIAACSDGGTLAIEALTVEDR